MSGEYTLTRKHLDALFDEAASAGMSHDVVGRALLNEIIQVWLKDRSWKDIADELRYTADNVNPDEDFVFARR